MTLRGCDTVGSVHTCCQVLTSCQGQQRMLAVIPWTCWLLLPVPLSGCWCKFAPSGPISPPMCVLFSKFPPVGVSQAQALALSRGALPRPLPSLKQVAERRRAAPHTAGKFGTALARATIAVTLCRWEQELRRRPRPLPPPVGCPFGALPRSLQMCKLLCEAPTAFPL